MDIQDFFFLFFFFRSVVCEKLYEWQGTVNDTMMHAHVKKLQAPICEQIIILSAVSLGITLISCLY